MVLFVFLVLETFSGATALQGSDCLMLFGWRLFLEIGDYSLGSWSRWWPFKHTHKTHFAYCHGPISPSFFVWRVIVCSYRRQRSVELRQMCLLDKFFSL